MWERFELFWTALEKFALFFSFIASLTSLVVLLLIYNAVADLEIRTEPALQAQDIDPLVDMTRKGFEQIQNAVIKTQVTISRSVPVTIEFGFAGETSLKVVGKNKVSTGEITIDLRDDAGTLHGEKGAIEMADKSILKVNMNTKDSRVVRVPLLFEVPVEVPLSSLNLAEVIEELQSANAQIHAKSGAGSQPAGGDAQQ
jgi:hypothetical protein